MVYKTRTITGIAVNSVVELSLLKVCFPPSLGTRLVTCMFSDYISSLHESIGSAG
jgi:hypothetical protein